MNRKFILYIPKILVLILFFLCFSCKKEPQNLTLKNIYSLTTSIKLENKENTERIEYFYERGESGFFNGKNNIPIHFKAFEHDSSNKAILISSGRTEAAIKYKEVIYDLYLNGFSIYILDHRGQGLSGRMTQNSQMGYIDSFQYYVDDMKSFYNNFIKIKNFNKTYLLAHSMGGAIGMTYLQQNPYDFNAAAFSSPMFGFKTGICGLVKIIYDENKAPKFAVGQSEYKDDFSSFKSNNLTGSKIRFNRMIKEYIKSPKAKLGGATYTWLYKSCQQFEYLFENISKIKTPFVIFSAENENIVNPDSHLEFIHLARSEGKACEYYEINDAQHELLIEKDEQRIETFTKALDFYSKY